MKYKLIVFDLDGVILDSKKNMQISWQNIKDRFDIKQSFDDYFEKIGRPFKMILDDLKIYNNQNLIEKLYFESTISNEKYLKFYDGVFQTLQYLKKKNIKISICTSKKLENTLRILKKININFDSIVCPSENLRGKPFPDQLLQSINLVGMKNTDALYVGDTKIDQETASNAKVKFVFAKYGYGKNENMVADSIVKFSDIIDFL